MEVALGAATAGRHAARESRARTRMATPCPSAPPRRTPHDQDRLRRDARAVPPDRPARLVRRRPRPPGSTPASWSASTSSRGRRSRARAPSRGRSWARWASARRCRSATAVTCPGFRYHPAVIAHAAATLGAMYPGRFWLGLGAGEALNEHVIGGEWPEIGVRSRCCSSRSRSSTSSSAARWCATTGEHFTLESAKLYTRPEPARCRSTSPRPARSTPSGPGRFADGMITVGAADEKIHMLWDEFDEGATRGRQGSRRHAQAAPDPRLLGAHRRGGGRRTP